MTESIFRLLDRHQRLDSLLRIAQGRRFADPYEIARLKNGKEKIRNRLVRQSPPVVGLEGL